MVTGVLRIHEMPRKCNIQVIPRGVKDERLMKQQCFKESDFTLKELLQYVAQRLEYNQ